MSECSWMNGKFNEAEKNEKRPAMEWKWFSKSEVPSCWKTRSKEERKKWKRKENILGITWPWEKAWQT